MKNKIITLIIGILIGGIVTATIFLLVGNGNKSIQSTNKNMRDMSQMGNFSPEDGFGRKREMSNSTSSSDSNTAVAESSTETNETAK